MTVLIVEDDEHTRKIYHDALVDRGYHVLLASQGAEGVALARRMTPDLILMDIRMPIMDGRHAMRYLKSDPKTSRIPIFAISAYAGGEAQQINGGLRFDRFLVKPVDVRDVIAAIEERIGPPRTHPRIT